MIVCVSLNRDELAAIVEHDVGPSSADLVAAATELRAARRPVAGEVGDHDDLYAATHVEEL